MNRRRWRRYAPRRRALQLAERLRQQMHKLLLIA